MTRLSTRLLALALLGLLALFASGVAQVQLSRDVLGAALAVETVPPQVEYASAPGGHFMPDGRFMLGKMPGGEPDGHQHHADGGHTHKGHADCDLCGFVAAMAAFVQPPPILIKLYGALSHPPAFTTQKNVALSPPRAAYASRAPPFQKA